MILEMCAEGTAAAKSARPPSAVRTAADAVAARASVASAVNAEGVDSGLTRARCSG